MVLLCMIYYECLCDYQYVQVHALKYSVSALCWYRCWALVNNGIIEDELAIITQLVLYTCNTQDIAKTSLT